MTAKRKSRKRAAKRDPGVDPRIGDDAVRARTGRGWAAWFRFLDAAGGRGLDHKQLVACVRRAHPDLGGWWTQSVVVAYEQKRGLRKLHEKPGGFEIGRSKTLPVPLSELYRTWSEKRRRVAWLGEDAAFTIRKATRERSLRITWTDERTHVDVYFWEKGPAKSQVQVQHKKLRSAAEAERMKRYWSAALARLAAHLKD